MENDFTPTRHINWPAVLRKLLENDETVMGYKYRISKAIPPNTAALIAQGTPPQIIKLNEKEKE